MNEFVNLVYGFKEYCRDEEGMIKRIYNFYK